MDICFIAEIGMNSNGRFDLNYELIRQAKAAGADIAKFQIGWRGGKDEINYMDIPRLLKLKEWCDRFDIEFMASILTDEAWKMVQEIGMNRYKIASRTVVKDPELCRRIIADGKETFVSLGMYEDEGLPFGTPTNVRYLYCKSRYPTDYADLKEFPKIFDRHWGYSDHVMGLEACFLAIARGARTIEKHFTLDKSSEGIRDHILSATPQEFGMLTSIGRELGRLVATLS